jgi:hypothetical protein
MDISRRTMMAGTAGAILAAHAGQAADSPSPYAKFVGEGRRSIKIVRVVSGDDGHSKFEETMVTPQAGPGNSPLVQFLNRKATAYAVYSSPPGHEQPERKVLAGTPELLYLIAGSTTFTTRTGAFESTVGTLMIFENSKGTGHSEKSGPEGYTAIKLLLAE